MNHRTPTLIGLSWLVLAFVVLLGGSYLFRAVHPAAIRLREAMRRIDGVLESAKARAAKCGRVQVVVLDHSVIEIRDEGGHLPDAQTPLPPEVRITYWGTDFKVSPDGILYDSRRCAHGMFEMPLVLTLDEIGDTHYADVTIARAPARILTRDVYCREPVWDPELVRQMKSWVRQWLP